MKKEYLEGDFHGHTRYSVIDVERIPYTPEEAVKQAKEMGLDAVAITGHDTVRGVNEALNAGIKYGLIVVPGVEIRTRSSTRFLRFADILALGITPEQVFKSRDRIPTLRDTETAIKWVHDLGGIAIAAHPKENGSMTSLSFDEVRRYSYLLDGIETVTLFGKNEVLERMAKEYEIARIGSSDFHSLKQIGLVGTKVYGNPTTWGGIVQAIKDNKVEAFIRRDIPEELVGWHLPNMLLNAIMRRR